MDVNNAMIAFHMGDKSERSHNPRVRQRLWERHNFFKAKLAFVTALFVFDIQP